MAYTTVLLQTITEIEGEGLNSPIPLNLTYTVPQGRTAGLRYVRAGSTVGGMTNITVLNNGKAMRYVPVAAGEPYTFRWRSWTSSGRGPGSIFPSLPKALEP